MATPSFLLVEMRLAFKTCARQYTRSNIRCFSNAIPRKQHPSKKAPSAHSTSKELRPQNSEGSELNAEYGSTAQDETSLAKRRSENRSLDTNQKVPVPMKIIPQAQLAPGIHLSPRQRLHVEMLTRRPNVSNEKKKVFKERLQIYHMGMVKEKTLATLKVASIVSVCAVNFIFVPAHLHAETAGWIIAMIWLAGFIPGIATHYMTKSWVNRIFLDLPDKARESPQAAMEYARNLPNDALLDIRYLKLWGLEGSVKGSTSEFKPTAGTFFQPLSFTWKDEAMRKHKSSTWTPGSFFVQSKSAVGARSPDTVPGVWGEVYRQLMKDSDKKSVRWESKLEPYET